MADGTRVQSGIPTHPGLKRVATAKGVYVADEGGFATRSVAGFELTAAGIPGDRHCNMIVPSDVRKPWHPRGTPVFNDRMLSLVSSSELESIAANLGVPVISPEMLGANLQIAGLKNLSYLPRGTRILFPSGATMVVSDMNHPCRHAGGSVMKHYPDRKGIDFDFVKAADRLRGVVAYVERPGPVAAGDTLEVRTPEQWIWED